MLETQRCAEGLTGPGFAWIHLFSLFENLFQLFLLQLSLLLLLLLLFIVESSCLLLARFSAAYALNTVLLCKRLRLGQGRGDIVTGVGARIPG